MSLNSFYPGIQFCPSCGGNNLAEHHWHDRNRTFQKGRECTDNCEPTGLQVNSVKYTECVEAECACHFGVTRVVEFIKMPW